MRKRVCRSVLWFLKIHVPKRQKPPQKTLLILTTWINLHIISTLYTIRDTCKAMCLEHFILYETIQLLVILSLQRNELWSRSDILNVAFIIRLSLLWKFNPYQLVWYQTFVFHFRTNAIPHFSLLKKKDGASMLSRLRRRHNICYSFTDCTNTHNNMCTHLYH